MDGMIEGEEVSEPKEFYYLFVQIVFTSLTAILTVAFTEQTPISFFGNHWWASVIVMGMVITIFTLYYLIRGFIIKEVLERVLVTLISTFIISLIIYSLWIYGVIVWTGYFMSAESFFCSNLMIGIISSFAASGLFSIIVPSLPSKRKIIDPKKVLEKVDECQHENLNYDPDTDSCVPKF